MYVITRYNRSCYKYVRLYLQPNDIVSCNDCCIICSSLYVLYWEFIDMPIPLTGNPITSSIQLYLGGFQFIRVHRWITAAYHISRGVRRSNWVGLHHARDVDWNIHRGFLHLKWKSMTQQPRLITWSYLLSEVWLRKSINLLGLYQIRLAQQFIVDDWQNGCFRVTSRERHGVKVTGVSTFC